MINDVNNLPLRERGAVTKARPQKFYVCMCMYKNIIQALCRIVEKMHNTLVCKCTTHRDCYPSKCCAC